MNEHGEAPPPGPEWDNMTMQDKLQYLAWAVDEIPSGHEKAYEISKRLEELSRFFHKRYLTTGETL